MNCRVQSGPFIVAVLLLTLCLSTCGRSYRSAEIKDIALDPLLFREEKPDVESIVLSVEDTVRQELPNAILANLSFQGGCQNLSDLQGVIHMYFVQERKLLWSRQYLAGLATVHTLTHTLDVSYQDWTAHPLSVAPLDPNEDTSMSEAAELANMRIKQLGVYDCDVTLSLMDEAWRVLCTTPGSGAVGRRLCYFEVNTATGETSADEP